MKSMETGVRRRHVLAAVAVSLAGCASDGGQDDGPGETPTSTPASGDEETPAETETPTDTPAPDGWGVRFEYDGPWQGTVSVTTAQGDSHQAFDGEGETTVDVESQMGVETGEVQDIVVQAQKRASDDGTLRVAIRKDGDVVAEGTTDEPQGQVMVSHHE